MNFRTVMRWGGTLKGTVDITSRNLKNYVRDT